MSLKRQKNVRIRDLLATHSDRSRKPTFLREWRKFRLLSQEAACERIDVSQATLSKIERGELPYNQDFLEQAASAYGCEPSDLISTNPLQTDSLQSLFKNLTAANAETRKTAQTILLALLKAS